jgi:hypothetical protein
MSFGMTSQIPFLWNEGSPTDQNKLSKVGTGHNPYLLSKPLAAELRNLPAGRQVFVEMIMRFIIRGAEHRNIKPPVDIELFCLAQTIALCQAVVRYK